MQVCSNKHSRQGIGHKIMKNTQLFAVRKWFISVMQLLRLRGGAPQRGRMILPWSQTSNAIIWKIWNKRIFTLKKLRMSVLCLNDVDGVFLYESHFFRHFSSALLNGPAGLQIWTKLFFFSFFDWPGSLHILLEGNWICKKKKKKNSERRSLKNFQIFVNVWEQFPHFNSIVHVKDTRNINVFYFHAAWPNKQHFS